MVFISKSFTPLHLSGSYDYLFLFKATLFRNWHFVQFGAPTVVNTDCNSLSDVM